MPDREQLPMPKIVLDRSGDLRKGTFYRFMVPLEDKPAIEVPTADWVVVPRTPTNDELRLKGEDTWMYVEELPEFETVTELKECPSDPAHVTFSCFTKVKGESYSGRVSPFIATTGHLVMVLSDELKRRFEGIKVRSVQIDPLALRDSATGKRTPGFWSLQFVGKAKQRPARLADALNRCPHCGKSRIICESCGYWYFRCPQCERHMVVLDSAHGGKTDKRLTYEHGCNWRVIDGRSWDGSDLIGGTSFSYASKRFIDWLFRIHAAPFYAEPVYFCVDGMSDQQKKWFDDLQKPFEA